MVDLIIWSKDRVCQLSLLLRSIQQFAPNIFNTTVLYHSSSDRFQQGYEKISQDEFTKLQKEDKSRPFKDQTVDILDGSSDYIAFSTDDTILYKPLPPFSEWKDKLSRSIATFSLRLGFNVIVQDCHKKTYQPPLNLYVDEGDTISWNSQHYSLYDNYAYVFGFDMHIYHKDTILPLIKEIDFNTTNQLETKLQAYRGHIPSTIRSFKHSVAVNIPINNLSNITTAGKYYGITVEELNNKFLDDYVIDLTELCKHTIVGCHEELPFTFIKG